MLRAPEKLAYVWAIMGNKGVIEAYFDLLEETLKKVLLDKPGLPSLLMRMSCRLNTNRKRL